MAVIHGIGIPVVIENSPGLPDVLKRVEKQDHTNDQRWSQHGCEESHNHHQNSGPIVVYKIASYISSNLSKFGVGHHVGNGSGRRLLYFYI